MTFTKYLKGNIYKVIISPLTLVLVLIILLPGLNAYPDRICYPLSTGTVCINSTSVGGLTIGGIDFYNKTEIDEQQLAQNNTLNNYYYNLSNFTGSMVAEKVCVFNGSRIECNVTAGLVDSDTYVTAVNVSGWGFFNNITNFSGTLTPGMLCGFNGSVLDCNITPVVDTDTDTFVTALNISGFGFYNNLSNITGTINVGDWCTFNGSKIECNVTPVVDTDTDTFVTTTNISGWGYYYSLPNITSLAIYSNLSNFTGSMIAGRVCVYNGSKIECNLTVPIDTDTFVTTTNISGWGYYYTEANLTGLLDNNYLGIGSDWVNLTGDTMSGSLFLPSINVSGRSNASVFCLDGICVDTWIDVNGTDKFYYSETNLTGLLNDNYILIGSYAAINTSISTRVPNSTLLNYMINTTIYSLIGDRMMNASLYSLGYFNNITNFTGVRTPENVCVFNGSKINCNYTMTVDTDTYVTTTNISSWGYYYSEANLTGLLDDNYLGIGSDWVNITGDTMSGNLLTTGLNVSGRSNASVFCLDGVCIDLWSEVNYSDTYFNTVYSVINSSISERVFNSTLEGYMPNASINSLVQARVLNSTLEGYMINTTVYSLVGDRITNASLYALAYYNNITNFTGTNIAGRLCGFNGSKIECNVTPIIDTDTYVTTINISGWGYYYTESNLTGLLDNNYLGIGSDWVNLTGDTMTGNLFTTGINVSGRSNASVFCLDGICVDTWIDVNGTDKFYYSETNLTGLLNDNYILIGSYAAINTSISTRVPNSTLLNYMINTTIYSLIGDRITNTSLYALGYFNNITNFTGVRTPEKVCVFNGSKINCNYTMTIDTDTFVTSTNISGWGFPQYNQVLNTTNNVTFNNITSSGGFISMPLSPKWKIGNYEANGNFSGVCYNGTNTYIGTSFNITSVGC